MRRLAAVALLAVGLATTGGCVSTPDKVRTPSPRQLTLESLERDLLAKQKQGKDDYESRWKAAQLCYELADEEQGEGFGDSQRLEFVKRGLAHAERATKLQPEMVEGHFYKLICMGLHIDLIKPPPAIMVADLRDQGERTARLDERFECAGAHRFLGIFYSECPETGPYGYGDADKAEAHFQRAMELIPDCPENFIAYAKHQLRKMENPGGASDYLKKAIAVIETHAGLSPEQRKSFRKKADAMLEEIEGKK